MHGCSPCHLRSQLARIALPCTPRLVCALHAPPPPPPTDSAADSAAAAAEAAAAAAEAARWRSMAFSTGRVASTTAGAAAAVEAPAAAAAPSTATALYAIDRHRALHVLPLGALAAAGEGAAGAEAVGASTAGADGGAAGGAAAGAAWWHGEAPPALRASLTTLLPCAAHAMAVLPPTPAAAGGVAPAVAVLAEPDCLRMLALG